MESKAVSIAALATFPDGVVTGVLFRCKAYFTHASKMEQNFYQQILPTKGRWFHYPKHERNRYYRVAVFHPKEIAICLPFL